MEEIWKDIKGFEGKYQISSLGRCKSYEREVNSGRGKRIIKEKILVCNAKIGYPTYALSLGFSMQKTMVIHRLIAEAFIPNPKNLPVVNHKDHNIYNFKIENLEWCSTSHNIKHSKPRNKNKNKK